MYSWYSAYIWHINNPLLTLIQHGCWPVGLAPVWVQETGNNPDDVMLSTRFSNVLINVMMMVIIIITNFLMLFYLQSKF